MFIFVGDHLVDIPDVDEDVLKGLTYLGPISINSLCNMLGLF